jgi:hypothetical protein
MPVNDAEGDEVGLADSEPPGVEAAFAVVVVVLLTAVVVFVEEPDATVVVVLPAVEFVVVVVELAFGCAVVVVVPDFEVECVFEVFVAEGLDEPHAAAIRPPARMTTPIANVRPTRRRPLLSVEWGDFVVCKVFLPHSSCSWHRKQGRARCRQRTLR